MPGILHETINLLADIDPAYSDEARMCYSLLDDKERDLAPIAELFDNWVNDDVVRYNDPRFYKDILHIEWLIREGVVLKETGFLLYADFETFLFAHLKGYITDIPEHFEKVAYNPNFAQIFEYMRCHESAQYFKILTYATLHARIMPELNEKVVIYFKQQIARGYEPFLRPLFRELYYAYIGELKDDVVQNIQKWRYCMMNTDFIFLIFDVVCGRRE